MLKKVGDYEHSAVGIDLHSDSWQFCTGNIFLCMSQVIAWDTSQTHCGSTILSEGRVVYFSA